ncbi:hypothetical protein mRhiFer1_009790 [Rhinolophus ferrumequinum]|uniref:Uncharacterized protein n=1 Tax=Rhinolophus ferrumequinum TaxID=59479 RepID=A0A7J7ZCM9_RHIFE|nr:hypothetical protein mRhiFer1_009790 [Rhinolophus ferrumequinum]
MKVKGESAKARLHSNIRKTKFMTTEEIYNFNADNEGVDIVKDFTYPGSVISSDGDCSQEIKRRLRLRKAAMGELGKIMKSKDVSLEIKAKIIHTLVFPIIMYRCESWRVKKAEGKRSIHFELEESSVDAVDHQKDEQVGLRTN